jgi:hypothetical protein
MACRPVARRMRALLALAAFAMLTALVPSAAAAVEAPDLPVGVRPHQDVTLPGDGGCHGCVGVSAGLGFGIAQCCDMPWFSVGGGVEAGDPGADPTVRAYACYTAFLRVCVVDETIPLVA